MQHEEDGDFTPPLDVRLLEAAVEQDDEAVIRMLLAEGVSDNESGAPAKHQPTTFTHSSLQ
jgi:hypothetical protein